jgi:hypothetical protein
LIYEDDILYVDIEKFQYKFNLNANTSKRIRLYLGKIGEEEFEQTVDTIKHLPDELQTQVRNYIRSIFNI